MERNKWAKRFLHLAKQTSEWSKDPSTKIGAACIDSETGAVLSLGYNGFPRGVADLKERYEDRPTKYKYIVHAEMNAIYNACLNGVNLKGSTLYIYGLPPCSECAKGIIQVGIRKIVIERIDNPERWKDSCELSYSLLEEAGVELIEIDV